jgi:hypothetical protein
VLQETNNEVYRSSRLSRLAEQLGWAIRQKWPDQVDPDCLRNAVCSLFYQDPNQLPSSAPAKGLSSEPHSFSRVFTSAFMESLALMFAGGSDRSEAALQQVSVDLGRILIKAIQTSPVVPEYFSQIGGHMIVIATAKSPHYGEALKTAMVKHGIVSVPGVVTVMSDDTVTLATSTPDDDGPTDAMPTETIDVTGYGITVPTVDMVTASQIKRFRIAGAAPTIGDAASSSSKRSALGYFEDLIRRGRLDYGTVAHARFAVMSSATTQKTHRLVHEGGRVVLRRIRIDCGLHKAADRLPGTP